ncbi:unnamed protein product [Cuscuta europaea]|uniref:Myb/SANT-like domain-containing protein n=2 Tax=Cuscuta europaea TaxID=41803 RepID=A0A9P1E132_CUSEU|nr:unnamed protein product [Cuscuta europaea]
MASTHDSMDKESFKWNNEYVLIFCELCIKYIQNQGCGFMKWREIKQNFEDVAKCKITHKSLKNKWDAMKKDWRIWKFLKRDGTDLGWDPITKRLSCSNEWWDKKTKENPDVKKFRNKYVDPKLEDLWAKLFEGKYGNDNGYITPTVDPESMQLANIEVENKESENEENKMLEEGHENNDYNNICSEDSESSSRLGGLDRKETSSFFHNNFTSEMNWYNGTAQVPPNQGTSTQCLDPDPVRMRCKRRQLPVGMEKKLSGQIDALVSNSNKVLRILMSNRNVRSNNLSSTSSCVAEAMHIVNRMVSNGVLEKCGDLWCFTVCLLEDEVRRELFLNMEDDTSRKAWLVYVHDKGN